MYVVLIVTLLVSLLYVRSRSWVVEMSYSLARKQEVKTELEQARRSLTLELATLRNPKRVERLAADKLGLKRSSGMKSAVFVTKERHEVP
jgi:cell division protein FtsL